MDLNPPAKIACPICANAKATWMPPTGDFDDIDCPQCGQFSLTGTAEALLQVEPDRRAGLSGKIVRTAAAQRTRVRVDADFIGAT